MGILSNCSWTYLLGWQVDHYWLKMY
uniref:Uncharacterized protein n=1 Tax=Rhizophora mucronata TaxID=61149 RepID=A0A2P2PS69_RHIMU